MSTTAQSILPDQFKNASKHRRAMVEELLQYYDGKELAAAQAAAAEVHRTGRPATDDEWRARFETAIEKAVKSVKK